MSISQKQSGKDSLLNLDLIRVPKDHRQNWRDFMMSQVGLPESDTRWQGMCESLQRQAHGFDARFSSAYAHMIATPRSEQLDPREAPRSAFIFVDDLRDSNAFGHVVGKWGWGDGSLEDIRVVTNDVNDAETTYDPGNVTVVPLGWFPQHWGDSIKFATLWFGPAQVPTIDLESGPEDTEKWVRASIEAAKEVLELMEKALRDNADERHPRHERAIRREIQAQKDNIKDLKGLLPSEGS